MSILIILAIIFAGLESLALYKGIRKLEFVVKPAVVHMGTVIRFGNHEDALIHLRGSGH